MDGDGDEFEALIDAVIDGRCDPAALRRFERRVRDDPEARRAYLDQVRMHALLEWRHGRVAAGPGGAGAARPGRRASGRWWALAAAVLIGLGLAFGAGWIATHGRSRAAPATLIEARGVAWSDPRSPLAVGTRLGPGPLRFEAGAVRLAFDTGAVVTVQGPADLRILSGRRLRAGRGRITARVAGERKGFAVETPCTRVVDQGTEFGVEVEPSGRTAVVVFEGRVDLERPRAPEAGGPPPIARLDQGEAVRVERSGTLSRIVSVERRLGEDGWTTGPSAGAAAVIRSVHDNLSGLACAKYYRIIPQGLEDDAPAYVDRPHEWNGLDASGLPTRLRGADYIMTFNEDKWSSDLEITVEVARPATLFVFMDKRERPPTWLTSRFTRTALRIGLDEASWPASPPSAIGRGPGRSINQVFTVWGCDLEAAGTITLGALEGGKNNRSMYGIAAVARP